MFRESAGPLDATALVLALGVDPDAAEVLTRRLNAMERDGQLQGDRTGVFTLAQETGFIAGKVSEIGRASCRERV